jgi:nitroreductase/SAM-dependent methyltransferase
MGKNTPRDGLRSLMKLIKGRRTVRSFIDKPIEEEALRRALDAAHWAPSACNRQLWEFVIIDDKSVIQKLEAITRQNNPNAVYIGLFYDMTKELAGSRFGDIQSAALAAQNLMLAAHAQGYGTKMMAGLNDPEAIGKLLGAPDGIEIIALIAFGHPYELPVAPERRPLGQIVHRNFFNIRKPRYPNYLDARLWSEDEVIALQGGVVRHGGRIGFFKSQFEKEILDKTFEFIKLRENWKTLFLFPYSAAYISALLKRFRRTEFEVLCQSGDNRNYVLAGLNETLPVHIGGFKRTGLEGGFYDAILALDSCVHIPRLDETLAEANRLLKPGGVLYLSMPSRMSPVLLKLWRKRSNVILTRTPYWKTGPIHPMRTVEVERLLNNAGFRIDTKHYISFTRSAPRNPKEYLKLRTIKLLRAIDPDFHDVILIKAFNGTEFGDTGIDGTGAQDSI